ncbi:unnamed protein product [Gadus morhua 'NCC']
MAPFGKGFLKARLKNNRTKEREATAAGKEIQITVCGQEKVVCGVTKHTTCADMVQALLEDHRGAPEGKQGSPEGQRAPPGGLRGEAQDFCLVERWKGLERALPPLTRILRLWSAWGDQKPLIHFHLVRVSDFVARSSRKGPPEGPRPPGARPKRAERGGGPQPLGEERQKRMVKKAFRKLEKLHRTPPAPPPGAAEVDRMVQLILAQDHTLREQDRQLRDLDLDLRRTELCSRGAGAPGAPEAPEAGVPQTPEEEEELQRYLRCAEDGLDQLGLQVRRHQDLILQLSRDIDLELAAAAAGGPAVWPPGPQEEVAAAAVAGPGVSEAEAEADAAFYAAELEAVRGELQRSLLEGVALHREGSQLDHALRLHQDAAAARDQEAWQLAAQLGSLQLGSGEEEAGGPGPDPGAGPGPGPAQSSVRCSVAPATVRLKHGGGPTDITDTDSDTGISSTHSQDSLSPGLEALPPVDTDV